MLSAIRGGGVPPNPGVAVQGLRVQEQVLGVEVPQAVCHRPGAGHAFSHPRWKPYQRPSPARYPAPMFHMDTPAVKITT